MSLSVCTCVCHSMCGGWRTAFCESSSPISLARFWFLETGSRVTQASL